MVARKIPHPSALCEFVDLFLGFVPKERVQSI
jgi:hypothetical protein